MTDQETTEARRPLEECAARFLELAREEVGEVADDMLFDDVIDKLADHNQTMIDAIQQAAPELSSVIDQLMKTQVDGRAARLATDAWTSIVNLIFEAAHRAHETAD